MNMSLALEIARYSITVIFLSRSASTLFSSNPVSAIVGLATVVPLVFARSSQLNVSQEPR